MELEPVAASGFATCGVETAAFGCSVLPAGAMAASTLAGSVRVEPIAEDPVLPASNRTASGVAGSPFADWGV